MTRYEEMPSTMWTAIFEARRKGGTVPAELFEKYRPPVLSYFRSRGYKPDAAEDLTQEVFLIIVKRDVVGKADQDRGKFRDLLFTIMRHTIADTTRRDKRIKRGGEEKLVSLDPGGAGEQTPLKDLVASDEADDSFDHLWVHNLVRIGMNRLRLECEKTGTKYFEALSLYSSDQPQYAEIAERLGASVTDVKNFLHQARSRLRKFVLQEVQDYCLSRSEYDKEADYLMGYLK